MCDPAEENPTCDPRPCSSRGPAARCAMGPGDAPRLGGGSKPVRGTGSGGAVLQRPGWARGCWLLACVKCCQGPSPVRRGRCLRQHCVHQPGTATVASLDVTSTSRNHGRESQESWSSAAGVRTETSYGETAGRAAAALRAPCPVYTVLTVPSRAAASESPSPPQQQHRLQ